MTWHQIRSLSHHRRIAGDAVSYINDLVLPLGPIACWPLDEASGATARCLVSSAQNGTATGVTWANDTTGPFGTPAPFFDGTNDFINIYSAALNAAFSGATGTLMTWFKVANAGVWTDGLRRHLFELYADINNRYTVVRTLGQNNRLDGIGVAGAGVAGLLTGAVSDVDWVPVAITWSDGANADEWLFYYDGVAVAAASAGLNAWTGANLQSNTTVLGAYDTTPQRLWHGWIGPTSLFDYVLSPANILALSNP